VQEQGIGFWNISSLSLFPISHSIEEGREASAYAIVVLGSYQNNQNGAVSIQLTGIGFGDSVLGVTVNLHI
jgi:hypothetical protein